MQATDYREEIRRAMTLLQLKLVANSFLRKYDQPSIPAGVDADQHVYHVWADSSPHGSEVRSLLYACESRAGELEATPVVNAKAPDSYMPVLGRTDPDYDQSLFN